MRFLAPAEMSQSVKSKRRQDQNWYCIVVLQQELDGSINKCGGVQYVNNTMPFPCHFNVLYSAQVSKQPCLDWLILHEMMHARCLAIFSELQSVIKRIPPIIFQKTFLPFPAAKVPSHGARRNPVPEAGVCTHRDPSKPRAAWWHEGTAQSHSARGPGLDILQQGWITAKIYLPLSLSP